MRRLGLVALALMVSWGGGAAWADSLFGLTSVRTRNIASIPKWIDVLSRKSQENLAGACGLQQCQRLEQAWWLELPKWRQLSRWDQLVEVNAWHNRRPYIEDINNWGRSDYWTTPRQFLDRSGDCEDYVIAKYYTLQQLGWPEESLRLVVLRDTLRGIAHAVLAVRWNGEEYILDNLSTRPLPDRVIRQYSPYYAVNAVHRWVFLKPQ